MRRRITTVAASFSICSETRKPSRNWKRRPDWTPSSADAWYLLGLIARQAGETDQAITRFKKSIASNPNNADALYMLGQELQRKGDIAGAKQSLQKVIAIRPQYSQAIYSLSRLLAKTDPDQARQLQERFEKIHSDQHIMDRAQSLGNFALASADAHDWPQAIAQLKEAIAVCGECSARPQLHKDLGLVYCHSGSLKDGRAELLEAQKLAPGDPDVEQALRVLDGAKTNP